MRTLHSALEEVENNAESINCNIYNKQCRNSEIGKSTVLFVIELSFL